jgi:methylenetetrahydrofolate reductase (NAD(P)H)
MLASDDCSLIEKIERHQKEDKIFFSFEFFPPKTETGLKPLLKCISKLKQAQPLFIDITWRLTSQQSSVDLANNTLNQLSLETVSHITCFGSTSEQLLSRLNELKKNGIKNIFALKGDTEPGWDSSKPQEFNYAIDLVKFIKLHFKNYFCIGVAGYPHGHPECISYSQDLLYLKAKVDAGADFIITQLFFVPDSFKKFVQDCRQIGIKVPIIPGIFPIQTKDSLKHVFNLAKVEAPEAIKESIVALRDDPVAIKEYGINHCVQLCKEILKGSLASGLHFYTFNRSEVTIEVLKRLDLWRAPSIDFEKRIVNIDQIVQEKNSKNKID